METTQWEGTSNQQGTLTVALPRGSEAVAGLAVTAVAAGSVDALGIALAHRAILALIDIFRKKRS